jgi:hypothetical protein
MLCDNYPGRFPLMQIVVLRHALPGREFSGIIFAVKMDTLAEIQRWAFR